MLPRLWIATIALLFFASCTLCVNPGLKARVTQKALNYGQRVGMSVLQKKMLQIRIPNMSGKKRVKWIGRIRYRVYGFQISKFGLPQSTVRFSAGKGIQLSIVNGYIGVRGNFRVKHFLFRMSGSFDVSVSRLSISETIGLTRDNTGRPAVRSIACSSNVGKVRVRFTKRRRWLYNLFRRFLERPIKSALNRQICPKVSSAINGLERNLKKMKISFRVNNFAEVDYSLVNRIKISRRAMDLDFKGEFYRVRNRKEPPFKPPPISLPRHSSRMLYLGISDFLANSAGFVFHEAGALRMKITDRMIPKNSPFRLNTKSFGMIMPQLEKLYPNMNMIINLHSTRPPVLRAANGNITIQAFGALDMLAILPNSSLASLFVLNIHASVSARTNIMRMKLTGSVTLNRLKLTPGHSRVGPVPVAGLELLIKISLKAVVLPKVNEKLARGVPLPNVKNLDFVNPTLMVNRNILVIATDVLYRP
ncbi:bactericidal permeability-increasing protein-like [Pristis pectinata]|uniref:bactericidal permeability-increasing protein-like n=1 Tax=Pristis pectinata TaxID=685728 RepID=UPI00223D4E79|nr:bactericidal permeability-increasing protein-like [Pristis pectinata]